MGKGVWAETLLKSKRTFCAEATEALAQNSIKIDNEAISFMGSPTLPKVVRGNTPGHLDTIIDETQDSETMSSHCCPVKK